MRKITVAGAGHGGITAALALAREGYDVTVYEKKKPEEMGYDWHDCISVNIFRSVGLEPPCEEDMLPFLRMGYYNPARTVKLSPQLDRKTPLRYIDRQFLIRYLVDSAEAAGVKFVFGANIKRAVMHGTTVAGITVEIDGQEKTVLSELVIDAAGVYSPVRRSLPTELGIQREIPQDEIFTVYRAYYNKAKDEYLEPRYTIFFFNDGRVGMDWLITEEDFVDVLIGTFGEMSEETAVQSVKNFREAYPFIGENLLRGGSVAKIPLRRTLPLIVANGYAAVGDSAAMTEPLSGSGICLSMSAGAMLGRTVIEAADRVYTAAVLWDYQVQYYKKHGNAQLPNDFVKLLLSKLSFSQVDGLFESKIFTEKELSSGPSVSYTAPELIEKVKGLVKYPGVIPPLAGFGISTLKSGSVCKAMPAHYDEKAIKKWAKRYSRL